MAQAVLKVDRESGNMGNAKCEVGCEEEKSTHTKNDAMCTTVVRCTTQVRKHFPHSNDHKRREGGRVRPWRDKSGHNTQRKQRGEGGSGVRELKDKITATGVGTLP